MCHVLQVSRSAYYKWLKNPISKREQYDKKLLLEIKKIYMHSRKTYGSPRIRDALVQKGFPCSKNRVARIMRENSIVALSKKKFKRTTNSDHKRAVAPNLVKQQFSSPAQNLLWTSDITYVPTMEGWLYLAVVLDVYSRKIVGFSMNKRMTDQLVIDAFVSSRLKRKPTVRTIFHSDRGSQYCSNRFKNLLMRSNCLQSMSATGCCYDNAITESFFHTLKVELVHRQKYKNRNEARMAIFEYIECFYNKQRMHSALGNVSPEQFENKYRILAA